MITLIIAGILLGLAVPSMHDFLLSNRLTTATNAMLADLRVARSEAIKRGTQAVVCTSTDGATCSASMAWHQGWMVFADLDNDGAWTSGTDDLVRIQESLPDEIVTAAGADRIVFTRDGLLAQGEGKYAICNLELDESRTIDVQATGRSSITDAQSC